MGVLINKYFKMPKSCDSCHFGQEYECVDEIGYGCLLTMKTRPKGETDRPDYCPLVELPPHGDLIDRDALMKDGWLSLWKRVDYMGGYAVHDLPLINPSIPVVIEKENC